MGRIDKYGDNVSTDAEMVALSEGRLFRVYDKQSIPAVGVTGNLAYAIVTGDKHVHIRPLDFNTSADKMDVVFYEDSVLTGGDEVTTKNYNRDLKYPSVTKFYRAPTVTSDGTEFSAGYVPGSTGVGGTRSGGDVSGSLKYALKPNTKYLWRFTNGSSAANTVFWSFAFEEVDE